MGIVRLTSPGDSRRVNNQGAYCEQTGFYLNQKRSTENTIAFLEGLHPTRLWALTAIIPDSNRTFTRTFQPTEVVDCVKWLDKFEGKRNLYVHVNAPSECIKKKASKTDINEAYYLYVDIDPRAGEDPVAEQGRLLGLLADWPYDVPKPNVAVWSGNGLNVYWRLDEPFLINKEEARWEDYEAYNKALEQLLDADNCHNVERILRLPGTANLPDEAKLKRGCVETVAEFLYDDGGTVSLGDMPKVEATGSAGAHKVSITGKVERIDDLEALDVPNKIKVIIAQGALRPEDCSEKQLSFSRSDWVFWVCCDFVRRGIPDDTIFAIITDPNWPISEHVFAQKGNSEKYAIRQIERAHDNAVEPALAELNDKHAVISNVGGKFRVLNEYVDPQTNLPTFTFSSKPDFCYAYGHRYVDIGDGKTKPLGQWWVQHPMARRYRTVTFMPEGDAGPDYNLWNGFAVAPRQGDCSLFLDHLRSVVCNYSEDDYNYLLDWMARCVQQPGRPGEVAVVMRGDKGTGKSLPISIFGSLFGPHFLGVSKADHLTGKFNGHLATCVVLFADEAFYAGNRGHEATLKTLITEKHTMLERKGIDAQAMRNYLHIFMASNNAWVVPASVDERRFFVLDVTDERRGDFEYFEALVAQINARGREALLHELLARDISAYNVRDVPQTDALAQQRLRTQLGQDPAAEAVFDMLWTGEPPECAELKEHRDGSKAVWIPSRDWAVSLGCSGRAMGLQLAATDARKVQEPTGNRRKGWLMSSLSVAREAWNASCQWPTGEPFDWLEDDDVF